MKLITIAIGIPVGIATKKTVERTWAAARPDDTPRKPNESGVHWGDAISGPRSPLRASWLADLLTRKERRVGVAHGHGHRAAAAEASKRPEEARGSAGEGQRRTRLTPSNDRFAIELTRQRHSWRCRRGCRVR